MAVAPRRGNPVPLIIFIVLFVFSTVAFVLVAMRLADVDEHMNQGLNPDSEEARDYERTRGLKLKLKQEQARVKELITEVGVYRGLTGSVNTAKLQKYVDDLAETLIRDINAGAPTRELKDLLTNVVNKVIDSKKFEEDLRPLVDRVLDVQQRGGKPSLLALIQILEREKLQLRDEMRRQQAQARERIAGLESQKSDGQVRIAEKQKTIDEQKDQFSRLTQTSSTNLADERRRAADLSNQLAGARKAMRDVVSKKDKEIARQKKFNLDLMAELDNLRKAKRRGKVKGKMFETSDEPADGKVILVSRTTGVVLDIGQKKGARRGLRFQVYRSRPDGTREKRGDIEIKTVFTDISRAMLVDGGNPINVIEKGDIIINPAFDPGRARIFVADTVFSNPKKQALREILSNYGSVLEDTVTLNTDYLIIGTRRGDHISEAEKRGVPMIREDELNAWLGR